MELADFEFAFRDLYLREITSANNGDVRMGTFILCGAFIDALALTYCAGPKVKGGNRAKWAAFMKAYFGTPYQHVWDTYDAFRNKLLHNYSPRGLSFIHGDEHARWHLAQTNQGVMLHRERFVADIEAAFDRFVADLRTDADLRRRALKHLEQFPPMGPVRVVTESTPSLKRRRPFLVRRPRFGRDHRGRTRTTDPLRVSPGYARIARGRRS